MADETLPGDRSAQSPIPLIVVAAGAGLTALAGLWLLLRRRFADRPIIMTGGSFNVYCLDGLLEHKASQGDTHTYRQHDVSSLNHVVVKKGDREHRLGGTTHIFFDGSHAPDVTLHGGEIAIRTSGDAPLCGPKRTQVIDDVDGDGDFVTAQQYHWNGGGPIKKVTGLVGGSIVADAKESLKLKVHYNS